MLQAPMFECLSLDPFSSFDDGGSPAEVGIGGCHIVQALVVALVVTSPGKRRLAGDTARAATTDEVKDHRAAFGT